jgi:meiotically up-regulated gene 157 (Mug157) protein
MELDNAIKYWVLAQTSANNLASKIRETYNQIIETIESQCGQQVDVEWDYVHSIEKENAEVRVTVNREGVKVSYVYVGWTRWSAFLPDEATTHWTCTLPQLEKVCAALTIAAEIVEDEVTNAAIDALFAGERPAAVPAAEGRES